MKCDAHLLKLMIKRNRQSSVNSATLHTNLGRDYASNRFISPSQLIFLYCIINAIQTAVIDQFIAWKTEKWILSEANQNKIVFSCRI